MAGIHWPGLLAWSTQHHDGTAPSQFKEMTQEDREFLEAAMEQAFGKVEDPNKVMLEAIGMIKDEARTDASIITALEVIDKCCDDPDCARNAEKLDGVQPLLDLLVAYDGVIRVRALEILALFFSNNPSMQEVGVKRGALQIFLKLFTDEPLGSDGRSKAFRAVVALVRSIAAFEEKFLREEDGINVVQTCLTPEEDNRTQEKAVSFVRQMVLTGRLRAEDVAQLSAAIVPLFPGLADASIQYQETIADCVAAFAREFPTNCVKELEATVSGRITELQSSGGQEESVELASLTECATCLAKASPA